jgi:hypothetical protein
VHGICNAERVGTLSSDGSGRKVFVGEVPHLSTWNCDKPLLTTCLRGKVVSQDTGEAVSGAVVTAAGVDYNGQSSAVTDANGEYCVEVKREARVSLTANAYGFTSATVTVDSQNVATDCGSGSCQDVDDLIIDMLGRTACVSGVVYNAYGLPPIPPAVVFTDQFTWTQTDLRGRFCLQVRPDEPVRLVIVDGSTYLLTGELDSTERTVTPSGEGRCGQEDGGCTEITIGEPAEQCGQCGAGLAITAAAAFTLFIATRRRRVARVRN